jgi:hypothetical protein
LHDKDWSHESADIHCLSTFVYIYIQDEAGPQLNDESNLSFLLNLFDPNRQEIDVAGGTLKIRINLVSFILTGNEKIKNSALIDRIPTIEFDKISPSIKEDIIKASWQANEENMMQIFPVFMCKEISEALELHKDFVIKEDLGNAGCRVSKKVVQELFSSAQVKHRRYTVGGGPTKRFKLDVEDTRASITSSFKQTIARELNSMEDKK